MIDVVNLQRKIKLDLAEIRSFLKLLPDAVHERKHWRFSIAFVSDKRMSELNGFFRGKDATTDVLSFQHEADEFDVPSSVSSRPGDDEEPNVDGSQSFLGDIVISAEQAERQANENGLTLDIEVKQLILHGLLHLCGYDHETDKGEMNRRELSLRKQLGIDGKAV